MTLIWHVPTFTSPGHRFGNMHQNQSNRGFEPSSHLRPRRHHRSGMLTHLNDMDTVSVCSFLPQKPHMQIEMEDNSKTAGPSSQVCSYFPFFVFLLEIFVP